MKSVLISIQPKCCELIASEKKTIEVRKTAPKLKTPFKCYIYCTLDKYKHLYDLRKVSNGDLMLSVVEHNKTSLVADGYLNGKIIGEFVCDEITALKYDTDWGVEPPQEGYFSVETPSEHVLLDFDPCLTNKELIDYGKGKPLYVWHISTLKIYDKPKELGEFKAWRWECETIEKQFYHCRFGYAHESHCALCKWIRRPPQSWGYVDEIEAVK